MFVKTQDPDLVGAGLAPPPAPSFGPGGLTFSTLCMPACVVRGYPVSGLPLNHLQAAACIAATVDLPFLRLVPTSRLSGTMLAPSHERDAPASALQSWLRALPKG